MIYINSWKDGRQQVGHVIGRHEKLVLTRVGWYWLETEDEIKKALVLGWSLWQQTLNRNENGYYYYARRISLEPILELGLRPKSLRE